jgi:MFS family permease
VAKQWYVYLIAKIVAGFAAGVIGTSVMTYISEITMPKMRGSHLSAFALFFAIGQVASAVGLEVLQNVSGTCTSSYRLQAQLGRLWLSS